MEVNLTSPLEVQATPEDTEDESTIVSSSWLMMAKTVPDLTAQ